MFKIAVKTKLSPEEVVRRSVQFFGADGGYGLKVTDQDDTHACFEGGGGSVDILACAEDKGTSVDLVSVEWDSQVKEFIDKIR